MSLLPHRDLDRVYFRIHEQDDTYDNVCFSDLTEDEQDKMLENRSAEWLKSMCKHLANTIRTIGDQFDLVAAGEAIEDDEDDRK